MQPLILDVHEATGHTYVADSIAKDLRKRGHRVGKERVRRLMQQMCIKVQCKNTWKVRGTTDSSQTYQPSPDLVQRCFKHTEPDRLWLSDFSELPSQGSKIYAVAIKDQASHRILGMHISDSLHTDTLVVAFDQAIRTRNLGRRDVEKKIIFHSDQGGQYNCTDFKKLLKSHDCLSSMGTAGDCYDNAPMESLWATMKTELMQHFPFRDVQHAAAVIHRWVHLFYNLRRRHTSIDGMSPMEYETKFFEAQRQPQTS